MSPGPIYAIGDVHGRDDLLRGECCRPSKRKPEPRRGIVFLGDIVDRGPDSRPRNGSG